VTEHREYKEEQTHAPARKKLFRYDFDPSFYDTEVVDALRVAENKKREEAEKIRKGEMRSPGWEVLDNRYRRLYELGAGGMGAVDLALDEQTGRLVVVKRRLPHFERLAHEAEEKWRAELEKPVHSEQDVLHIKQLKLQADKAHKDFETIVERYEREVRALAKAGDNPFIVKTHDVITMPDGSMGIVMEQVKDPDLHEQLQRERLPSDKFTAAVIIETCLALTGAHDKGVLHRDIKPENIFVQRGEHPEDGEVHVRVGDFGVAQLGYVDQRAPTPPGGSPYYEFPIERDKATALAQDERSLTEPGYIMGTTEYMAPEIITGQKASARSDLYALGVVMYRMLAGRTPFSQHHDIWDIFKAHKSEVPQLPREVRADHRKSRLELIAMRLLSKHPDDRYQSALEVARAIREVMVKEDPKLAMKEPYIWIGEDPKKAARAEKREAA